MREHKAVAYIRVSTEGQSEKFGMEAQKAAEEQAALQQQ